MGKTLKSNFIYILKSTLIAVLISVGLILVFAVTLKFVDFSDGIIKIINQVIKIFSIFFGCFSLLKKDKTKALVKGTCLGAMYSCIAFVVFSILNSSFTFGLANIFDLLFSTIFGAVCGVFCANIGAEKVV